MCDGHDRDNRVITFHPAGRDDGARPVLTALLPPAPGFVPPEIGVRDNEAGIRVRQTHLFQLGIEVVEPGGHLRFSDSFHRRVIHIHRTARQPALNQEFILLG